MCNTDNHDFYNWLAGLIDGEGHFGIYSQNGVSKKCTPHTQFQFRIKLRGDDRKVIEEIKDRLGFGNVYYVEIRDDRPTFKNAKPQVIYQTGKLSEALKLIEIIDCHCLRSKKRRDYQIWRRAALLSVEIGNTRYENFMALSEEIKSVRKYSQIAAS